jgi:hypothetical protein
VVETVINKEALLNERTASLYSDEEFTTEISTISFGDTINVISKIDDIYKVSFNNHTGYINTDNLTILDNDIDTEELAMEDVLPALPIEFSQSYLYFLAQLDSTVEGVKGKLFGLSLESTNSNGFKELYYDERYLKYTSTEDEVIDTLTIDNINQDEEIIESMKELGQLSSDNS